jgi:glycosyltransferase involved in cell wall biosynthesis
MSVSDLPLVSIVTPSYNQAPFLEQTILSVLEQDYSSIEHIVIDGGSTDGSLEVIKEYEDRLAYWVSEPDQGQSDAINKGFNVSSGAILGWLNSDDLLERSAISIAVYFLLKHPKVGMVYGNRVYIDQKDNIRTYLVSPAFHPYHLSWGITIPQETAFWRRQLFFDVGGLDLDLKNAMDTDLWCRFSKVTRIKHIPAFMGRYRVHPQAISSRVSNSSDPEGAALLEQANAVRRRHFGRVPSPLIRPWVRRFNGLRLLFEKQTQCYKQEIQQIRLIQTYGLPGAFRHGLELEGLAEI